MWILGLKGLKAIPWNSGQFQSKPKICEQFDIFCGLTKSRKVFPPDPNYPGHQKKNDSKKVSARPPHSHPTIASLHVTSRRPCWMKRTKAFLSSGNLTLFSCEFFKKKFYCIVIQHGRLLTWFQTKNSKNSLSNTQIQPRITAKFSFMTQTKNKLEAAAKKSFKSVLILVRSQT